MFELIKKDMTTIQLKISYLIPYGSSWGSLFSHTCSSEHETELMYAHLLAVMEAEVTKIRREAYEQGWKDKSAKKPKQNWFSCRI